MKVFVTGGGGYIGTTLVPFLLKQGHVLTVLDRFFFGENLLSQFSDGGNLKLIRDDTRFFDGKLLHGYDAVV
ncbi:MAG: NAD-dependent epimerase/dehydratase family protein, partial [Nitrososphaerales archaeon]